MLTYASSPAPNVKVSPAVSEGELVKRVAPVTCQAEYVVLIVAAEVQEATTEMVIEPDWVGLANVSRVPNGSVAYDLTVTVPTAFAVTVTVSLSIARQTP
jgi:hypothetical protein